MLYLSKKPQTIVCSHTHTSYREMSGVAFNVFLQFPSVIIAHRSKRRRIFSVWHLNSSEVMEMFLPCGKCQLDCKKNVLLFLWWIDSESSCTTYFHIFTLCVSYLAFKEPYMHTCASPMCFPSPPMHVLYYDTVNTFIYAEKIFFSLLSKLNTERYFIKSHLCCHVDEGPWYKYKNIKLLCNVFLKYPAKISCN